MPGFAVPVATVGSNTMPVDGAMTAPAGMVVLSVGVAAPISATAKAPEGGAPGIIRSEVTTAMPWLLVPRSGSMATAVGCWKPPMLTGVSEVAGELPKRRLRLISEIVLLPVLATMA